MDVITANVFKAALALPEQDRIELVEQLLATLGPETDGVEEMDLAEELHRRSDEIDQGVAELTPWSELKNEPL
jgi:putative addiction module component (TIGR02574 family)